MIKNIIIGVLGVMTIMLFFYGVVQQIEANRKANIVLEVEQKLKVLKKIAEDARLKAIDAEDEAKKQSEIATNQRKLAEVAARQMAQALKDSEQGRKLAEEKLEKLIKKN